MGSLVESGSFFSGPKAFPLADLVVFPSLGLGSGSFFLIEESGGVLEIEVKGVVDLVS